MSEKKQHKQTEAGKSENMKDVDIDFTDSNWTSKECAEADGTTADEKEIKDALEATRKELEDRSKKCDEYLDKLQRTVAEFDNFKKRSAKEKEALYIDAVSDVVGSFLPVVDNVERALQAISADSSAETLKNGVEMIFKQFRDTLKNIGVEEIAAVNETFDPMVHNAVMHVNDESFGHSVVVEEFQKGYKYKDKVIRYSMVKVAN